MSLDPSGGARNETGDLDRGRALTFSCSPETAAFHTGRASAESADSPLPQGERPGATCLLRKSTYPNVTFSPNQMGRGGCFSDYPAYAGGSVS